TTANRGGGGAHLRIAQLLGGEIVSHASRPGLNSDKGSKAALTERLSAASAGGWGAKSPCMARLSGLARNSMAWPLASAASLRMRAASAGAAASQITPPAQSPSQCRTFNCAANFGAWVGATITRQ